MKRLDGKRAVITGAASGIGRATAMRFAAEGAALALLDVQTEAVQQLADEITARGGRAVARAADVSEEDQVERAFAAALSDLGGLDVVVSNAGIQLFGQDARVHELDVGVWDRTHAINLRGMFLTCKHGVRALLDSGGGSVVCTGSPTGLFGVAPDCSAYSASKAGVFGLARAIAAGYAADGIRCNVVVPGFTATPLVDTLTSDAHHNQQMVSHIPLGRAGTGEDVAAMMVFLASDESCYATGGVFSVDGGSTAV